MTEQPIDETTELKLARLHVEALVRDLEDSLAEARRLKEEAEEARNAATKAQKKSEEIAQFPLNSPDPLLKVDCDHAKLLFINPAAYNKYSDILRRGLDHPLLVDVLAVADEAYRLGRSMTREVQVGAITYQQVVAPYLLGNERTVTIYNYDITKLKDIEEHLRRERENAEAANRAKSDFLANMSHELRTPMNGVLGMASLLKGTALTSEQNELVETICNSGETLLMLLNDILDFSKIEAGQLTLEDVPFNLADLVCSTTRLLEPLAARKGIALETMIDRAAPMHVIGDPARIRQILTNLIGNAIKFTGQGAVSVALKCDGMVGSKAALRFQIDDTGIGIKPEHIKKIFNKFTQADETTTRRFGGTGLGLTICKLLTETMGGEIGVDSFVGVGSTFWFTLPLTIASDSQTAMMIAEDTPRPRNEDMPMFDFSAAKMIVIDDHPINLLFAKKLLQKFGCRSVDTVDNGNDALQMMAARRYDLVITDCQMPEMDGYAVSRIIREREQQSGRRTPIIAMTANAMVGDREKCIAAGMDDYVSKPINEPRLYEVIVRCLLPRGPQVTSSTPAVQRSAKLSEAVTASSVPVDMDHLNLLLGDDPVERKDIIAMFLKLSEESVQVMRACVQDGNQNLWKKTAHKLKGSAANFGAAALAILCKSAEEAAPQTAETKESLLHDIQGNLSALQQFLTSGAVE